MFGLGEYFGMGGAQPPQPSGPRTLGAMPNPGAAPMPQAPQPPQMDQGGMVGGMDQFMGRLQSPGMMGLLGAGTSMLGAAGQPGGLGQALMAGGQGGLGGMMMAKQAQQEEERNNQLMEALRMGRGVAGQGQAIARGGLAPMAPGNNERPQAPMPQQAPGLYGAY